MRIPGLRDQDSRTQGMPRVQTATWKLGNLEFLGIPRNARVQTDIWKLRNPLKTKKASRKPKITKAQIWKTKKASRKPKKPKKPNFWSN